MRNLVRLGLLLTALTGSALAQEFADENGTIQPAGPRTGANGIAFLNVEGFNNGAFASYGAIRWDLSATIGAFDNAFGQGNWEICKIDLALTQSNAGFTTSGPALIFYSDDDATLVEPPGVIQYPFVTAGVPDLACDLADPILSYKFIEVATGTRDVHNIYAKGDTGARADLATDIELDAGDTSITMIIVEDPNDPNGMALAATYAGRTNTSQAGPELIITAGPIGTDCPPVANAGPDQSVTDNDQNQTENVTLDGSASFPTAAGATITNYTWKEGATTVATGVMPTVAFGLGTHNITLTITDSNLETATDTVLITVVAGGNPPFADAGPSQEDTDADGNGSETVALDASNSFDSDGAIVSYTWTNRATGAVLATGVTANVALPVGLNTVELLVEDNAGHLINDWTFVKVLPQTVYGRHDFDANFDAIETIDPTPGTFLSAGDAFEVKQRGVSSAIPFGVLDDSGTAGDIDPNINECAPSTPFEFDSEGPVACAKQDAFFAVCDIANVDNPNCDTATVSYEFDITGATQISVMIDMGAAGDFEFGDPNEVASWVCDPNNPSVPFDIFDWTYSIDAGPQQPLFTSSIDEAAAPDYVFFNGRVVNIPDPLSMNGVELNNLLRSMVAPVSGTGSTLTITLTARNDSEGMVFDDIIVFEGAAPGCTGDADGDGDVDLDDLLLVLGNFNQGPGGDVDGDNDTDLDDLLLVLGNFNCQP